MWVTLSLVCHCMQAIFVMFSVTHVMLNDELDRIRKEDVMAQLMSDPST